MEFPPHNRRPGASETPASSASTEELALVERAQAGDAQAYDALVRRHYPAIHATSFHLVGNPEDAEDLAQECFVRACRSLHWYRGDGAFGGWLRRILVHLARDRYRARGRHPANESIEAERAAAPGVGPVRELGRREFARLLAEAVQRLPVHLRIPLVLRTLDGLDYEAVSRATGVKAATARTQVMKARRELQRWLGPLVARSRRSSEESE